MKDKGRNRVFEKQGESRKENTMKQEKICSFDLETIPAQNIHPDCVPKFDPDSVKLGQRKDPLKIQEFLRGEEEKFNSEVVKKMSLDPYLCQILCFSGVIYDARQDAIIKEKTIYLGRYESELTSDIHHEYEMISQICDLLRQVRDEKITIVTFNGYGFDFPVLQIAAVRLNVPVIDAKTWQQWMKRYGHWSHYDLMQELGHWNIKNRKSLDFYAKRFGIGTKTDDMDGSQVFPSWQNGEDEKIKSYCRDDALLTAKLYARVGEYLI